MGSAAKITAAPLRSEAQGSLPRPFGRLTLLKLLARGGMGEVYLAVSGAIEGAERPCVVKLIRRDHAEDPSFVARFLDETRVQAQLDHPGVARALEAATGDDGQPYVVVEYIEGTAVSDVRARAVQAGERLAWSDAVALGALVCEALAHVHERTDARGNPLNIVHRDLSPQNVMLGFDGGVRLIDFGTARAENRRCHTVAGVVYAKPGYVAPEVANGVPGGAQADLYALGVMLWELCAGRRFLQGDAGEHLAAVGADRRPLPPVAALAGAPPELDEALARLTAFSPKRRTGSAREALGELRGLLGLAAGPEGAQARLAVLMGRLYPSEPGRSRSEFERLVALARRLRAEASTPRAKTPRAPAADDRLPGTAYRLVRKVDEGAVGVVYEAEHVELGQRMALKVLGAAALERADAAMRFRREARAMSRLTHPQVVRLFDFGKAADGRLFLAMEFVEGETLERRLAREGGPGLTPSLRLAAEAARVLAAVHRAGVVHRDVKPTNLLLTERGLKLADFGVAQVEGQDGPADETGATTRALCLFGTPEYMAPEQAEGDPVDGRADVYALGVVLYEMLTGALPFRGRSQVAILQAKRRGELELPSARAPERKLPREIDALVAKALAVDPAERYASADAFAAELEAVIARSRPEAAGAGRRGKAVAAAVIALGTLALASLAHQRRATPTGATAAGRLADPGLAAAAATTLARVATAAGAPRTPATAPRPEAAPPKPSNDELAAARPVPVAPAAMALDASPFATPAPSPAPAERPARPHAGDDSGPQRRGSPTKSRQASAAGRHSTPSPARARRDEGDAARGRAGESDAHAPRAPQGADAGRGRGGSEGGSTHAPGAGGSRGRPVEGATRGRSGDAETAPAPARSGAARPKPQLPP